LNMPYSNTILTRRTGTPTPAIQQHDDDEEMQDENDDMDGTGDQTMLEDGDEEDGDDAQNDSDGQPRITTIPRRRRGGKAGRTSTRNLGTPEPGDDASDSGTPYRRRGRGRGFASTRGGFRRKSRVVEAPHVMVDGERVDVVNDDAQLDFDAEGEEKVDEYGALKGDREYRVRTFKIIGRGDRLYMLSTEPARCCGFRDSYLFFNKHPKLFKVLLGDAEKKDLIDREILPNSYKGRNIGVVTARSVYREFGARIIVGGKKVTDDYKVAEAREAGDVEGELADPNDRLPQTAEFYNRNRYVAWHGASDVYRGTGAAGPPAAGKPVPIGSKRKSNCTVENWQLMHAREAV
jgi:chromatin structure-remodeling complex protein RSC7